MRRIAVIGNGGGGKSTLARAVGQHLGIPVHEVEEVRRRVQAMRSDLLELVTKSGRAAKLVHLRTPHEMARWLALVTRTPAGITD